MNVNLPFDRARYEKVKGTRDCSYYLELLELGFKKASKFESVPLNILLDLIQEFRNCDCKNEWLHQKKRFKNDDLEVILICEFTTNYFQLIVNVNQLSTKMELASGVVMRTETGISIQQGMYKSIIIDEDIVITDRSDSPRIVINKAKVLNGELSFLINGDKEIQEMLSYKLYGLLAFELTGKLGGALLPRPYAITTGVSSIFRVYLTTFVPARQKRALL